MTGFANSGLAALVGWASLDVRRALFTSGQATNPDNDFLSDLDVTNNELNQSGYARGALANETVVIDDTNNEIQLDADDWTYTSLAAGRNPATLYTYIEGASDAARQILTFASLTSPPNPNGGNYTIQVNAEGIGEISN